MPYMGEEWQPTRFDEELALLIALHMSEERVPLGDILRDLYAAAQNLKEEEHK